MKKRNFILSISALLFGLALTSCGEPSVSNPTSEPDPTASVSDPTTPPLVSDPTEPPVPSVSDPTTPPPSVDPTVAVEKVILSIEDENGEGTLENPYTINTAQGESINVPFTVLPSDATNKDLLWEVGRFVDGAFELDATTGVEVSASGNNAVITVSATAEGEVAIKVTTADGTNIVNYIKVVVEAYIPVSGITLEGVMPAPEDAEYDYIFKTALGTSWDMSGEELARKTALLNGEVMSGLQAPRNLTYWPTLYNMPISIQPEDASNAAFTVESDNESVFVLKNDGSYETRSAGEALITVKSYAHPDVKTTLKVEVAESLYDGILKEAYDAKGVSGLSSWDLDADHATDAQFARYDDWNLVMVQSNERRGSTGIDDNQKIFYMGEPTRPYGINIENNVNSVTGGLTTKASGMMWAKLHVPAGAKTFNVKIGSTGSKTLGEYRVLFVNEQGVQYILTEGNSGWVGFKGQNDESTVKLVLPDEIKDTDGAMVVEHRVPTKDGNAELSIKKLNFEGQVDPTGIVLAKNEGVYKPGDTFNLGAQVKPDNVTDGSISYYVDEASEGKGITVDKEGNVSIALDTAEGVYHVWAQSNANPDIKAKFTITVQKEVTVNSWGNKHDILNGVSGVKWEIVGPGDGNTNQDAGVGEGADLHAGENGWAALQLAERLIKDDAAILTYRARTFRPTTEILPEFTVKVIEGDTETVVRAIGADSDEVLINNEEGNGVTVGYDLSAWIGKTVTLQIGIDRGNHGVVTCINFIKEQVAATSVALKKTEGEYLRDSQFSVNAFVKPDNATNSFIDYSIDKPGKGVEISGVGSTVTVTIAKDAELGDYKIIATARGTEVKAEYALKVFVPQADHEVNSWGNKDEILNGKDGVAWTINGGTDAGVGEGADLVVGHGEGWSSLVLVDREIKSTSFLLTFGARVFHRDGETYPKFEVRITVGDVTETIRGIGQENDYFFVDTDATQTCSYDLSKYIGQTVKVEIGITTGTHAVVQHISFSGNENAATSWMNKDAILNGGWVITGDKDAGVGEGADIMHTNSYISQSFLIGSYNDALTFGARVFHRDGETYPDIKVVVVDGDTETLIRANGVDSDTVHVDTDAIQHFTYDLSSFIGKTVEVRIQLANNATHCVITDIALA